MTKVSNIFISRAIVSRKAYYFIKNQGKANFAEKI